MAARGQEQQTRARGGKRFAGLAGNFECATIHAKTARSIKKNGAQKSVQIA
jgi:hypothetical protein